MTARLRNAFVTAAGEKRAALVAYLTFGDPDPATSILVIEAVAKAGSREVLSAYDRAATADVRKYA